MRAEILLLAAAFALGSPCAVLAQQASPAPAGETKGTTTEGEDRQGRRAGPAAPTTPAQAAQPAPTGAGDPKGAVIEGEDRQGRRAGPAAPTTPGQAAQASPAPGAHDAHAGHSGMATAGETPATRAYREAGARMHRDMDIAFTGDADADFVRGMIPHHQGAIDNARIELQHGRDPELRRLAERIVADQEREIAEMRAWLSKRGK